MILGKKWKFLKKNSRAGSRFLGVPQVNQAGLVKTSARKKRDPSRSRIPFRGVNQTKPITE